ncbi:hypothetical protein GQ53DRAFT_764347 [Thozetella sp. PMI_491]|nr:hypothetical protein GQ53DRAFT_764347 [Thozetella sp. PMI_491]
MSTPLRTFHIRTLPMDSKLQLISRRGDPLNDRCPPLYSVYHGSAGKRKAVLYYGEVDPHGAIGDMAISLYTSTSKLSVRGHSISLKVKMWSGDILIQCPTIGILTWKGYKHIPQRPLELKDESGVRLALHIR